MPVERLTRKLALAIASCLILILLPLSGGAQNVLKKGAHAVQKGVETGVEKTKEGAETVGRETKKAITGEDESERRMKSTEAPSSTTTTAPAPRTTRRTTSGSTATRSSETRNRRLPGTAGELSLLLLAGGFALAGFGASKLARDVS